MKKQILFLLVIAFAVVALTGCTNKKEGKEEEGDGLMQIPNPVVVVENFDSLKDSLYIDEVNEDATDVVLTIISNKMAQIDFKYNEHEFTYRAINEELEPEAISGIYGDYIASNRASKAQYFKVGQYFIAYWINNSATYCVSCDNEEALASYVEPLLANID